MNEEETRKKEEESEIWLLQRRARRGPLTSRDSPCLSMAIWRTERTHKAL